MVLIFEIRSLFTLGYLFYRYETMSSPPVIRNDPTLSIATSSACLECTSESCKDGKPCRLAVAPNKSAASVRIFRNRKVIDVRQSGNCENLIKAAGEIGKTITIQEFANNLREGKYSYTSPRGGGCNDVTVNASQYGEILRLGDRYDISDGNNWQNLLGKITYVRSRQLKDSFLSENKLTIIPNVPFEMSYNGNTFSVTKMALFHPSPVRIENVQHDAVITLNDPIDNPKFVVMIPLVASSFTTPSTAFFSRIGSAFSKVVLPNQEGEETIPTGSDWSISKLFNTMSDGISITDSFYTWTGMNGTSKAGRYIVMEKPMFISAGELTELRNIPPIDPKFGIPSISEPVSYRKEICCKASGPGVSTRESFTVKEGFTPMDIFAYSVTGIFVLIASILALYLSQQGWVTQSIRDFYEAIGRFFARQFDTLYGRSIPKIFGEGGLLETGDLSQMTKGLQSGDLSGLKNLSSSAQSEDASPALQNLANNPAIQGFAKKFGA